LRRNASINEHASPVHGAADGCDECVFDDMVRTLVRS